MSSKLSADSLTLHDLEIGLLCISKACLTIANE